MIQVLPENRKPSFGEKFSSAVGAGLEEGSKLYDAHQENKALKKMGIDLAGVKDPELRKILVQNTFKKKQEDTAKFETGLQTISDMREILSRKNVGRGSGFLGMFGGDTSRDRSELEQLGKSLIPLVAAGVPIRNQKEFEEYKKIITNPSSLISDLEGALNGLERIFNSKLAGKEEKKESKIEKAQFNRSNPEHEAKARQLFKKFGDKEKVREILSREFEGV